MENPNLHNDDQLIWAFAASPSQARTGGAAMRLSRATPVVTACSRQAREMGVRSGMRLQQAQAVLPDLRVLVYGPQNN